MFTIFLKIKFRKLQNSHHSLTYSTSVTSRNLQTLLTFMKYKSRPNT